MKNFILRLALICGLLSLGVTAVQAQDLGAVKTRMKQRIAQIDQLKLKGAIGENNRGFVEVRAEAPDASSVVSAENADREAVYAAIAKQSNTTADAVGKARARRIVAESAAGVWVQDDSGKWTKK
ncbi:YdbL family protein [Oleiharenicola lentus]|uniref:YdbL family protein n=1 Tax=Oleiharenicola lentus TaxID=2508720 RepID=UPI003F667B98